MVNEFYRRDLSRPMVGMLMWRLQGKCQHKLIMMFFHIDRVMRMDFLHFLCEVMSMLSTPDDTHKDPNRTKIMNV